MKVFCIRGPRIAGTFSSKRAFDECVDGLADELERLWVEVKEVSKK